MDHARLAGTGHSGYEYTLHPDLRAAVSHSENTAIAPTGGPQGPTLSARVYLTDACRLVITAPLLATNPREGCGTTNFLEADFSFPLSRACVGPGFVVQADRRTGLSRFLVGQQSSRQSR